MRHARGVPRILADETMLRRKRRDQLPRRRVQSTRRGERNEDKTPFCISATMNIVLWTKRVQTTPGRNTKARVRLGLIRYACLFETSHSASRATAVRFPHLASGIPEEEIPFLGHGIHALLVCTPRPHLPAHPRASLLLDGHRLRLDFPSIIYQSLSLFHLISCIFLSQRFVAIIAHQHRRDA